MKFAILRGNDFLRYELDDKGQLEPGAKRYPVEIDPQPQYDRKTEYLEEYLERDPLRQVVCVRYTKGVKPPKPAVPEGATVIIQQVPAQVDLSATDQQIAALQARLAEMQAAQAETQAAARIGDLIGTVMNGKDDAAIAAANALVPMAEAQGLSVDEFVRRWLNKGAAA